MMQQKKTDPTPPSEVEISTDAAQLRELLQSLSRYFEACEEHITQDGTSIPASYAQALMLLLDYSEATKPPTLSELVELLSIDKSNVTRLAQRMSDAGHVIIERDEQDRRAKRIVLSPSGEELARFIQTASLERYHEVLSHFDEEAREEMFAQLIRLNEIFAHTHSCED